ncbi:MAG TPA: hypothetical protein PLB12_11660 [Candidatus Goldiibacteriota bacterium]|mgnify:FL=1|nr:hypothetical protein [Candidatus Goldiibacteriota bacterium]HRQ44992.1 hypothetical protein [Candidatus Goldiibacteriota bacterium]
MKLFNNKYRTDSVRLKSWDYSSSGFYYVTICVLNHKHSFGVVDSQSVNLNGLGEAASRFFLGIPEHFNNVSIANHIVMPNHIHGIIVVNKEEKIQGEKCNSRSLKGHKKGSLSVIISQYKAAVKRFAVKNNMDFNWQDSYYEHIIRDEKSMMKISEYIQLNPLRWELDEYNT